MKGWTQCFLHWGLYQIFWHLKLLFWFSIVTSNLCHHNLTPLKMVNFRTVLLIWHWALDHLEVEVRANPLLKPKSWRKKVWALLQPVSEPSWDQGRMVRLQVWNVRRLQSTPDSCRCCQPERHLCSWALSALQSSVLSASVHFDAAVQFEKVDIYILWWWINQNSVISLCLRLCLSGWCPAFLLVFSNSNPERKNSSCVHQGNWVAAQMT